MNDTVDIIDKGFSCLVETLGVVNAERFIAMIKRDRFDYTVRRREYFDNKSLDEINKEAVSYAKQHPHRGHGKRI